MFLRGLRTSLLLAAADRPAVAASSLLLNPPAERYKESSGWIDEAVSRMREQHRERVAELTERLADA
jgi:hypothetical protein